MAVPGQMRTVKEDQPRIKKHQLRESSSCKRREYILESVVTSLSLSHAHTHMQRSVTGQSPKNRRGRTLFSSFYEAGITLILKPDKDTTKKTTDQ